MSRWALARVRSLVANPGMVNASTLLRGSPRPSIVLAATTSAWLESSPPDTPIATFWTPVLVNRFASPWIWMAYTSAHRSSRAAGSLGT